MSTATGSGREVSSKDLNQRLLASVTENVENRESVVTHVAVTRMPF